MKLKTFFGVTILVGMIIGGSITSIAADDAIVTPDAVGTTVTHNWSFKVDRTYEEIQGDGHIKLEYWAIGNQVRSDSAGHPTHVEYYEFINGQYCQVGSN
ncbi:MAG: hypothetical protein E7249_07795 [Paenibacillaceae bacterium]|nr:hypothetical protein [Paenibacillaceae bacterium]